MKIAKFLQKYKNSSDTVKATVWYTACNVLQKLSAFLLIPFLTRILSKNSYGIYTVFLSWLEIFEIFATMRLYSNGYITGLVKNEEDADKYTCSIQFLSLIITSVFLLAYHIVASPISELLQIDSKYVYMMFFSYYATSSIGIWTARQRVNNRYRMMTVTTLLYGVLSPIASIVAAFLLEDKLTAAINFRIFAQLTIALPFLVVNLCGKNKGIVWRYCVNALKYNIPLIPYYLSMVILNSSDRIMIQRIVGEEEAAIYSVAYSIAMAIFVVSGAFTSALQPWMLKQLKDNNGEKQTITYNVAVILIAFLNLILLITSPEVILITASKGYYEAIWTMPPIIISLLIMFIYQQFLNIHSYFGKTLIVLVASIISAVVNIVLNYICINQFGYIAAGYTTLISYSLILILYFMTMKKICKQKNIYYSNYFSMKFILGVIFAFVGLSIIITLFYPFPVIRYGLIGLGIIVCLIKRKSIIALCQKAGLLKG